MKNHRQTSSTPVPFLSLVIPVAILLTMFLPARILAATVPNAPTIGTATPANTKVVVAFTAPASDGGSAITSYTVTATPGGQTANGSGSPLTVSGLANGTAYTFSVKATNVMGDSLSSTASAAVTPATVPGIPSISGVIPGSTQATVSFTAPVFDGGSSITGYTVTATPGGQTASGSGSPLTVSGLTDGTAYTFTVKATNVMGDSPPSPASVSVNPGTPFLIDLLSGTKAVAAGDFFTVALKKNGAVAAWGDNSSQQIEVPADLGPVMAVAAGSKHAVALLVDGTVRAWGDNTSGQTTVPNDLGPVIEVAASRGPASAGYAGRGHSVVLQADGAVRAWGDDSEGQISAIPSDLGKAKAIAAGDLFTVAVLEDGTVRVWGDDTDGQKSGIPAGLSGVTAVAAGRGHILALKTNGTVVAWGRNHKGQTHVPEGLNGVTAVASGWDFSVAMKSDGTIIAWGNNDNGQTTVPSNLASIAIAAGEAYTLAITADGALHAWGRDIPGSNGVPSGLATPASHGDVVCPAPVGGTSTCTITHDPGYALASFAVNGSDALVNVNNDSYQMTGIAGNPTLAASFAISISPQVKTGVQAIATGKAHNVVLLYDGTVIAWGENTSGQATVPSGLKGIKAVAAGESHTLALKEDGTVIAWGRNLEGQSTVPPSLGAVQAIAAGDTFSIAMKMDGSTVAWGQIEGNALPPPFTGIKAVAAGARHILALQNDGTVVTAGADYSGVLTVPSGLTGVQQIAAGKDYSLALKSDGTVVAWGKNMDQASGILTGSGQLKAIAAGRNCALALKSDGNKVWVWGDATNPQVTGKPSTLTGLKVLAAGLQQVIFLREDGTIDTWGTLPATPGAVAASYGIPHGAIACLPQVIIDNRNAQCTISPDSGYHLASWLVNGSDQFPFVSNNLYTLSHVQQAQTIVATFAQNTLGSITAPGVPIIDLVTSLDGQVKVNFIPPGTNGGSAITEYIVTSTPEGKTGAGATSPVTVPGLENGKSYTFTVQAKNAAGAGPLSSPSAAVIPATVPGAPAISGATPANGQVTVAFTAPSSDGGSAITGYTVTSTPGGKTGTGSASPITVLGLTNGTAYTFTVQAKNAAGAGPLSSPSAAVIPAAVPGAPTISGATPANGQVTVAFTAPSSDGGSAITGYTVTSTPGGKTASGATSPLTVSGLTNGTVYSFTVQATNGVGIGLPSNSSAPVTPATVPGIPSITGVTTASGQATISFTAPAFDGGSSISGYTVTSNLGGKTATGATSPHTVSGLTDGTTYTFTVQAKNAVGIGPASSASLAATPGSPLFIDLLSGTKAVTAGDFFTVALKKNGKVAAWGDNSYHQLEVPAGLGPVKTVAAGSQHTVVLLEDGTVQGWGDDKYGQAHSGIPADLGKSKAIAASRGIASQAEGRGHTIALQENGTVRVWGDNSTGQADVPSDLGKAKAIAAGDLFSVAVREDGTVRVWGDDSFGQISGIPAGLSGVTAVATARAHILALKSDGTVVAWGLNHKGQTDVPGGLNGVTAVAAGWGFSLALQADGTVVGWGNNDNGQITMPAGLSAIAIAAGEAHTLAITADGALRAWGFNIPGSNTIPAGLATPAPHGTVVCPKPVGGVSTCTITPTPGYALASFAVNGSDAFANVNNGSYLLANITTNQTITASFEFAITPWVLTGVKTIATGGSHNVALLYDGTVQVWGNNDYGQKDIPFGLNGVTAIAAGDNHTVALREDGTVIAWGRDNDGQTAVPASLNGVIAVAAGDTFSVALKADGSTMAWGKLDGGAVPAPFTGVKAIAAGARHILAIKNDDTVITAGANHYGVLTVPSGLAGVRQIAAGEDYSLALKAEGTVIAWGKNDAQQTGVPTGVGQVQAIAAGRVCALALKSDGQQVWAWGNTANPLYSGKPAGLSGLAQLAAGREQALALKGDGTITPWGTQPEVIPAAVTASYGLSHGAITCQPALVVDNGTSACSFIPETTGYHLTAWLVNGSDQFAAVANNTATLANITQVTSVAGSFAKNTTGIAVPPGAPTAVAGTSGDGKATVSFTPPGTDGGSAITEYTVTSTPDGKSGTGAASPITVPGLENGKSYTFTVQAKNAAGAGPLSSPSAAVIPATVPGAPAITGATPANGQVTVAFIAPASNGGNAITGYTVTSTPGGKTASGATSPLTVSGLTNGTAYTFTVQATNGVGSGAASAPSASVTPATVPEAPAISGVTPANGQVTVVFTSPANGGSPITGYTVTASPGGNNVTAITSPITVPDLENGKPYTFTVQAKNAAGSGPISSPSAAVVPATVPGAPAITAATPANGQVTVAFTAPAADGGSAITGYTVTSNPGGKTASGTTSPLTVSGLANGTAYTFIVKAANTLGDGSPSAVSIPATPATKPSKPLITAVTPSNGKATVVFTTSSANGGSAITGYTVTSHPDNKTESGTVSPITISGLTNGTTYTFTLTATNSMGESDASAESSGVKPGPVPPGDPSIVSVVAGNGQITVDYNIPTSDGGSPITGYQAIANPGGVMASVPVASPLKPITIPGLANGITYTVVVLAINDQGNGTPSTPSNPVTPATKPTAPTITAITPDNGTLQVAFSPTSDGGSPIIEYQITGTLNGKEISSTGTTSPLSLQGLSNGVSYSVTVRARNAWGWGTSSASQAATPQPNYQATVTGRINVKALAAGSTHTVALMEDGTVRSWGDSMINGFVPKPTNLGKVIAIAASHGPQSAAGNWNIVVLQEDGVVRVWGDDSLGQVSAMPTDLGKVIAIAAGDQFVVAVKEDGSVVSWGDDLSQKTPSLPKPEGLLDVKAIATGRSHILALKKDGSVVSWGLNHVGQAEVPAGLNGVIAIGGGWGHSVALKDNGEVFCWGNNSVGQLDKPANLPPAQAIAIGMGHTAVLLEDGTAQFWGSNGTSQATVPQELTGWDIKAVSLGDTYSIVLNDEGTPFAWGAASAVNALPADINTGIAYGSIPSPCAKSAAGSATCTALPAAGYTLSSLVIDGQPVPLDEVIDNKYSFDLSTDRVVTASFSKIGISPLTLNTGWNLLGAWGVIDLATTFTDGKTYLSLWKWTNNGWAVRLPSAPDAGAQYANSKGFTLLSLIESGAGFWINNAAETEVSIDYSTETVSKSKGWNLLGKDGSSIISANKLVQDFSSEKILSIWKWENKSWAVSLPADPDKGKGYAESKGFSHLTVIKPGEGYWMLIGE